MLELAAIDLDGLCDALEDHSYDTSWWIDPRSGEIRISEPDSEADEHDERGWVPIDPVESSAAYGDMEDFVARVEDRRAADLLGRAIQGRGAFRRFKDTLFEFRDVREKWFAFHDARLKRRAVAWLVENNLVSADAATLAEREFADPDVGRGHVRVAAVARDVAADLAGLYGERLARVVVFGSSARSDAEPGSDLDLLVVLAELSSPWNELRAMDEVLWAHTQRSGITISALPVSAADYDQPASPVLLRAKAEGLTVG